SLQPPRRRAQGQLRPTLVALETALQRWRRIGRQAGHLLTGARPKRWLRACLAIAPAMLVALSLSACGGGAGKSPENFRPVTVRNGDDTMLAQCARPLAKGRRCPVGPARRPGARGTPVPTREARRLP